MNLPPKLSLAAAASLALTILSPWSRIPAAPTASLLVHADRPGPRTSPSLYGLFFEEINCSGDGGLYAEMVRNRSFEDANEPTHWTLVTSSGAKGEMAVDSQHPLSEQNKHALKLTITDAGGGRVGIANQGYWGLALAAGQDYVLSLNARAGEGFSGPVTVSLESRDGKVYAQKKVGSPGAEWQTFKAVLRPGASDPAGRLVVSASQTGTLWLDMISLFPKQTWKNRVNGLRPDLAGMLDGLHPGFVRFPGGCWVEGDDLSLSYHWKQTIGKVADRRTQYNIWQYNSTHGLGFHEYLQLCEDLRATPLFVINCGMSHRENVPMDQLGPWVQDALDAIEYANGPRDSQWGKARAENGHPAPFNLEYMEIGNENGGAPYRERYAAFYHAIKAKYPRMHLIADEWGGIPTDTPVEIVDEHYYSSPGFFIQRANQYDSYNRQGHKVYVGEYAVTQNCGQGNLRGALGEAAFMTGLERNSDVVIMASYAPLFANLNYKKWNPDLINFDAAKAYGTPSYYVQQLFAENRGDVVLPTEVKVTAEPEPPAQGAIGLGTWDTQAEYKDIKVTAGDRVLFASDGAAGLNGWRVFSGDWQAKDGTLQQVGPGSDHRLLSGDPAWRDYTLTLKARKLGGAEGFLILFHVQNDQQWLWWNIGGWGNTRHAIERASEGGKSTLGRDVPGSVETGRWYDVRVELEGPLVRCFLDGKKLLEVKDSQTLLPLHTVAGRIDKTGDLVLKTVNVGAADCDTDLELAGLARVAPVARVVTLTSANPADENSLEAPTKVAPRLSTLANVSTRFHYSFPANSLTVMRFKTQ